MAKEGSEYMSKLICKKERPSRFIFHVNGLGAARKIITAGLCVCVLVFSLLQPRKAETTEIDYQSLQENPIDTVFRRILEQEVPDWDQGDITGGLINTELKQMKWPIRDGRIAGLFNLRASKGKRVHKGVDILAPKDTPIFAILDGVVEVVSNNGPGWKGYGRVVFINHDGKFWSLYSHCNSINVKIGQKVKQGERIASVGQTGRATGFHLHFELRNSSGVPIDPMRYLPKEDMLPFVNH